MQQCGYDKLKECFDNGELNIHPALMEALSKMDAGDLQGAADALAVHEQMNVVQPVYERHEDTFDAMQRADGMTFGDQTSIPAAYECTRDNLVPLGDLEIQQPRDRVKYYGQLLERMFEIEGRQ